MVQSRAERPVTVKTVNLTEVALHPYSFHPQSHPLSREPSPPVMDGETGAQKET